MKKIARSLGALSAAVAFGAGSALVAPMANAQSSLPAGSLGSSGAEACGDHVVTPSTQEAAGWSSPEDENSAKIAAVVGADETIGAAALTFDTHEAGTSLYKNGARVNLSDLLLNEEDDSVVPISFDYTSKGQAPALQIRLNNASLHADEKRDGHEIGFATIVWTPAAGNGTWQTATPGDSAQYWVTRDLKRENGEKVTRGQRMTLQEIIDLNPKAVVTDYGVQKTRENASEGAAIDNFTLGCETTNFELDPEDEGSLGNIFGSVTGIFSS